MGSEGQNRLAELFFGKDSIVSYGFEMGNWYGFIGFPGDYGLSSQYEIVEKDIDSRKCSYQLKVVMPKLLSEVTFNTEVTDDGYLRSFVKVVFLESGVVGDLVLHLQLNIAKDVNPSLNNVGLLDDLKYHYVDNPDRPIELFSGKDEKYIIRPTADGDCLNNGLRLMPYATRVNNRVIRYHSRLLAFGGTGNSLLIRSRGVFSCAKVIPWCPGISRWLYRRERKAPTFLPNTQLCAVRHVKRGDVVQLEHRIKKIS